MLNIYAELKNKNKLHMQHINYGKHLLQEVLKFHDPQH